MDAGLATGFGTVVLLNPEEGLHAYMLPPEAPSVVEDPLQIAWSGPAVAPERSPTVTVTSSDPEQPFASVAVTV